MQVKEGLLKRINQGEYVVLGRGELKRITGGSSVECGPSAGGAICPNGLCCSPDGYCGSTPEYCGEGGVCVECESFQGYTSCWYSNSDPADLCRRVYPGVPTTATVIPCHSGCTMN